MKLPFGRKEQREKLATIGSHKYLKHASWNEIDDQRHSTIGPLDETK